MSEVLTNLRFTQIVSYMASRCASWAGDSLTLADRINEPMSEEAARRFIEDMRGRLVWIEEGIVPASKREAS